MVDTEILATSDPVGSSSSAQLSEQNSADLELNAMNQMVTALSPLSEEQRNRALEYIFRRYKFTPKNLGIVDVPIQSGATIPPLSNQGEQVLVSRGTAVEDIRTLKENKLPKSAIEMAVLVAYYVSELAPVGERKKEITKPDLEKHFKAAGFKLPADAAFTLVNAKNAGYLDSAGAGQYSLNPVGYNLVVHRMGNREKGGQSPRESRRSGVNRRSQGKKQTHTRK